MKKPIKASALGVFSRSGVGRVAADDDSGEREAILAAAPHPRAIARPWHFHRVVVARIQGGSGEAARSSRNPPCPHLRRTRTVHRRPNRRPPGSDLGPGGRGGWPARAQRWIGQRSEAPADGPDCRRSKALPGRGAPCSHQRPCHRMAWSPNSECQKRIQRRHLGSKAGRRHATHSSSHCRNMDDPGRGADQDGG